ncbi:aspartyl-tRNA(Asn) amidotransferase subunit B [Sulfuriferula multivorans]|uniref:Aspartyl/glutamyl-tRNA(Asn/Gln) amidotransferase subunit B n=1 Tax=Sulfuriferula multivorans TaxID=1559896 RepID=A0A401JDE8_9PROT|nr:Asp-tRNA(Asn)/Glu-tRNA(Gln) amidotransferase subunit GatB [Sulfuriferula multivorans]GBL45692.1 aspartyl-tRNA(Asn) amidotransferase subunit B [Sulfuriferula multivorans]
MQWEIVIGLEVHTQLSTSSKIFSGASTAFGAAPNTQACAVDIALPGVLPVLNKGAVERAVQLGLAIGGHISRRSVFARKNYFYPDLPKGYQISQMELPVVEGGSLTIQVGETEKTVRITRAHLEEDAGKSLHEDFHGMTGIDLNRAGTPLLEIVSEPDMRGSAEAVAYAKTLHSLVVWLGICDGNMQEGSFRCDANVSVRRMGETELGKRCEIKNLNSFRFLEHAIDYEARRQIEIIEDGGVVRQETRLYDPDRNETRTMRSKEDAHDYRYFPDPDLLPLVISEEWIERTRAAMPELPEAMRSRFVTQYGLPVYDAGLLTASKALAAYYEALVAAVGGEAKTCANWVMGDLSAALNRNELDIADSPVSSRQLAALIQRITDGTLSGKLAKEVFEALWQGEGEVDVVIEARGLKQVSDSGAIEAIVDAILAANPNQVAEYRSGKDKMFGFFVGQAMKAMKGKANPQQLNDILKRKLG